MLLLIDSYTTKSYLNSTIYARHFLIILKKVKIVIICIWSMRLFVLLARKKVLYAIINYHNRDRSIIMLKDIFMTLSENQVLNGAAKKYGLKMGAQHVVAGTNIEETMESIKKLNAQGISCTVDNLGEFVFEKEEALEAKAQIIAVIEAIEEHQVDAHISLKPSQLGLDIDYDFALQNLKDIIAVAKNIIHSLISIWNLTNIYSLPLTYWTSYLRNTTKLEQLSKHTSLEQLKIFKSIKTSVYVL